ncbi:MULTISPECIES: acyltransferase [unclassified Bosea (in: a-proteobacteria)]|uniref:acyltransferase family protein n=1 Tax=unclassified Bosea (in: a-proteobacteria) TaxID=2653178 RepID=UPI0013E073E3|nr:MULTISPECIES: acyltransferase [unclassified Bosea (in: a-proteobacteria)]
MKQLADRHVPELDGIRGIACLLVVLLHCGVGLTNPSLGSWQPVIHGAVASFLIGGVDLFFVLSGFLIGGILIDHRTAGNYFKVFWARRAARILPVYFLLLATYVAALAARPYFDAPWADKWLLLNPLPIWSYITFMNNNVMAYYGETGALWIGVTWSLCVEEQFYLIFPLIVYFSRNRTVLLICVSGVVIAPIIRTVIWTVWGNFYMAYFPTPSRMDTLMFGVLVAMAVRNPDTLALARRWRRWLDLLALLLVVTLTGLIWRAPWTIQYSFVAAGCAYAILRIYISDGLYRRLLTGKWIVAAGLISYPLYMYHQAVNGLMHGFIANQVPTLVSWRDLGIAIGVVAVSVSLATISTVYFESFFRRLGRKLKYVPADPSERIPVVGTPRGAATG